jgi:hypothetical protein
MREEVTTFRYAPEVGGVATATNTIQYPLVTHTDEEDVLQHR